MQREVKFARDIHRGRKRRGEPREKGEEVYTMKMKIKEIKEEREKTSTTCGDLENGHGVLHQDCQCVPMLSACLYIAVQVSDPSVYIVIAIEQCIQTDRHNVFVFFHKASV